MLTAREWLLLPEEEQKKRGNELSAEECHKLRMELSMVHLTEEEKKKMSEEEKYRFTHPKEYTKEEMSAFHRQAQEIIRRMQTEAKTGENTTGY